MPNHVHSLSLSIEAMKYIAKRLTKMSCRILRLCPRLQSDSESSIAGNPAVLVLLNSTVMKMKRTEVKLPVQINRPTMYILFPLTWGDSEGI